MDEAEFGSIEAASLGGKARAKAMSPGDRKLSASLAARTRWEKNGKKPIPRAIKEAPLKIGNIEFECAVLDDDTRLISERAFSRAIGSKRGGSHWIRRKKNPDGANLPVFLSAKNLRPYISMGLASALSEPTVYLPGEGSYANGIKAELIPQILDVWLKAREHSAITKAQEPFAKLAEILMRGLAATGIVALIDEATGFQEMRDRNALATFLARYVTKEIREWVRLFPLSFFRQLCRLKGVAFREDMRLPRYFGIYVNDLVYSRLAPGVLAELQRKNPVTESGRRKNKHTQWLTEEMAHPKLLYHLGLLEGIAKGFKPGEFEEFRKQVDIDLPPFKPIPLFADMVDSDGNFIKRPKGGG